METARWGEASGRFLIGAGSGFVTFVCTCVCVYVRVCVRVCAYVCVVCISVLMRADMFQSGMSDLFPTVRSRTH